MGKNRAFEATNSFLPLPWQKNKSSFLRKKIEENKSLR
jgi:hypothetical protein